MIETVELNNEKALKHVRVALKPLTVLVGTNDTGKSTFLEALRVLFGGGNSTPGFGVPTCSAKASGEWRGHRFSFESSERDRTANAPSDLLSHARAQLFRLPSSGVVLTGQGFADADGIPELQPDGTNVPGLIDFFLRHDRARLDRFCAAAKERIPGLLDVQVATPHSASRRVDLVIDGGHRMPADQASTGVRALLFFLALAHHPKPPPVILLEEPESGLHPKRLEDVLNLLRDITQGKLGEPAQVILSTHSPYLLDCVRLPEDQVLVFRRHPATGARTVNAVDAEGLKVFLDEFKLGEVWFNRGEDGLLPKGA